MNANPILSALVGLLMVFFVGCSSSPKLAKGTPTASTDSLSASAKKVQQDFSQTQADFGKLESEAHFPK